MIEGKGPAQNGRDCIIYHASVPKRIGKTKERGSEKGKWERRSTQDKLKKMRKRGRLYDFGTRRRWG